MGNFSKIATENPNVIETTSKKIKLYQKGNKVIFTFDSNPTKTSIYSLNLSNFDLQFKSFPKASIDLSSYKKKNSYLYDNKLFQIASGTKQLHFCITDLNSGEVMKEYHLKKEDSITFKNSPIIQQKPRNNVWGGSDHSIKKIEKTAKFLRKITTADLGISVYKIKGNYNIILGGTRDLSNSAGVVGMGGFTLPGGFGSFTSFNFNTVFYGYNSYNSSTSTYINCLFDDNFNHVNGEIPFNTYDYLNEFKDSLDEPEAINVFLHQNKLHYNFLDIETGIFKIYVF